MPRSQFALAVDEIQRRLRPMLSDRGFKVRGRTFNLTTTDGLTQVVNIQMGPSDPPGTKYVPGLTSNLHGLFAVNLGVYIPEVAAARGSHAVNWVQDYNCAIRSRLGALIGSGKEVWWRARTDAGVISDLMNALETTGFPFLDRYSTREDVLRNFTKRDSEHAASDPPLFVAAVILAARGESDRARASLSRQIRTSLDQPHHVEWIRELAAKLGLGEVDQ